MIPLGDDNRRKRGHAYITWSLIAANILVYIFIQGFGTDDNATLALSVIPSEIALGHRLWTLITCQFAHASLSHLAGNMLYLGIFGDNIECRIGKKRYILLYLLSGTFGILAHVLVSLLAGGAAAETPLIGASAAISGILASYLVLFPGNRIIVLLFNFIPTSFSAWIVIASWFVLQIFHGLAAGVSGGTAYIAHIAGFIVSWLWSRHYKYNEAAKIEKNRQNRYIHGDSDNGFQWWVVDDK
ncbi:MAG: rhomboid family intramembrane serine protease [Spirochaetaceae bacterium]|nr:rhomboid family intramembrane serine protease [Spirochaetaceae bacterium]